MGLFVYGIISKWYIMITVTALVVTFWVFKGLEQTGVLSEFYNIVSHALTDAKTIARYCTPKIKYIDQFWQCIEDLPQYTPDLVEQKLTEDLQQDLDNVVNSTYQQDPYAKDAYEQNQQTGNNSNINTNTGSSDLQTRYLRREQ